MFKSMFLAAMLTMMSGCVLAEAQTYPYPDSAPSYSTPSQDPGCQYPGRWVWDGWRYICQMPPQPVLPRIWWGPPLDYSYPGGGGIFFHFGGGGHHDNNHSDCDHNHDRGHNRH